MKSASDVDHNAAGCHALLLFVANTSTCEVSLVMTAARPGCYSDHRYHKQDIYPYNLGQRHLLMSVGNHSIHDDHLCKPNADPLYSCAAQQAL